MKTLVICRHAKSDWEQDLPDFERPLNKRGKQDLKTMGEQLHQAGFLPDLIISSPAKRAKATAEGIAEAVGYGNGISFERSIYDEGHGHLASFIQSLPDDASCAMIFGHNPTLEQLVQFLLQSRSHVQMPTLAMVCLESESSSWKNISPGMWTLRWVLIPKLLRIDS